MRISLGLKLILIYLLVTGGFLLAGFQGLAGLYDVSDQVRSLLNSDLQRVVALREMKSSLVHLKRTLQLVGGNTQNSEVIRQSRRAFERDLRALYRTSPKLSKQLVPLYEAYLKSAFDNPTNSSSFGLKQVPYGRLSDRIDDLLYEAEQSLRKTENRLERMSSTGLSNLSLTFLGFFLVGLLSFAWFSLRLLSGLKQLKGGMDAVGQGNYDIHLPAMGLDELGVTLKEFNQMSSRVKSTRQMFLDASPLTYLPGNIAIERALMDRLRNDEIFALCYIDLDDFKPYNDHYGYARGSEVIKATADLIHQVQRECGSERDFVGHIGGDDFVLVTSMAHVEPICTGIIEAFDKMIPEHYSEEDREKGVIISKDRFGETREFPLMTISLAVVTNANRDVHNPVEIAKIAAEIKEYVKLLPGSNYLVDRRTHAR